MLPPNLRFLETFWRLSMPKAHLTDISIRALKPEAKQLTYWDDSLPGFGLRVSQRGAKSWVIMSGRDRKLTTLSRYPSVSLKDARSEAKKRLQDPKPKTGSVTFDEAVTLFLAVKEQRNKERTVKDYRRLLTKHFSLTTPLPELTATDIMKLIDDLADTPSEQAHAFVAVKTLLQFCVARGLITHSPIAALQTPTKAVARSRVLSDTELATLLPAASQSVSVFNQIVLLCVYTGLRRGEAGALRWDWINAEQKTITLPSAITKNNREHHFPFGDLVQRLLDAVESREGFLFPGRDSPNQFFNGWSRAKLNFDKGCPIDPWTLHDLRRTFATNLAALGTPVHVTERLLNHVSGAVSGVAAIYNRHSYFPEMRAAIELWENRLQSLVRG
jgi:integrase